MKFPTSSSKIAIINSFSASSNSNPHAFLIISSLSAGIFFKTPNIKVFSKLLDKV